MTYEEMKPLFPKKERDLMSEAHDMTESHEDPNCIKCHLQDVKDGNIDADHCGHCAEEAMRVAELIHDRN